MAAFMLRPVFRRCFSRTTFHQAIQRQIIQEDGKLDSQIIIYLYFLDKNCVDSLSSKTNNNSPTIIDDPLQHDDYFNVRPMVTLEDLFK